ncbi:MAG: phosphate ABC transporter permease subunit PstC [Clostridia bacterium]|nr:phosphate ABC transporter permease subunit PstC [Clostridia bacterium]
MKAEKVVEKGLVLSALVAVVALVMISFFIISEGWPILAKVGISDFLFSSDWFPTKGRFGIMTMILGTFYVTAGALVLGVPLGVGTAIFLAEIAPKKVSFIIKSAVELLAGIPSTVYGFFGIVVMVPLIREYFGGTGFSILAGSIILAIMVLPTIINVAIDAIRAVPREYKEGSLALGATHWQTIIKVILPAASSGLAAAVVLGMGRAIGETMAVLMVIGNATSMPLSILDSTRTLTSNIALEMAYASGDHLESLFTTGIVLFIIIMVLNLIANYAVRRAVKG